MRRYRHDEIADSTGKLLFTSYETIASGYRLIYIRESERESILSNGDKNCSLPNEISSFFDFEAIR